jgi:hypothetical protein
MMSETAAGPQATDATPDTRQVLNSLQALETRCKYDFAYACQALLWIKPREAPLCRLALNWPQRYVYEKYLLPKWSRNQPAALVTLKARREGLSTLFTAWQYHKARWWRGQNCYITAHDDDTVAEIFDMVLRYHEQLPEALRPPTRHKTRQELEYAAPWDSHVRARVAKYLDIGRGKLLHHAMLSECAYYPDPETILGGILEAVPSSGPSSIILESTANGAGEWFEYVWLQAVKNKNKRGKGLGGRQWEPVFLPWFWNPWNIAQVPPDFAPTAEERQLIARWKLRPEQLMWARYKLEEMELLYPGNGARMFAQEHPATAEESFLLSGQCIFPEPALERLKRQQRPPQDGFRLVQMGQWHQALMRCDIEDAPFLVWEGPRPGCQYTIGVDVSRGVGRDNSAIVVLRMPEFYQVAHWYDNYTSPKALAYVVAAIARWYGHGAHTLPIVAVEVNDAGILVNAELEMLEGTEPLEIYVWEYWDKVNQAETTKTGWLTTNTTKHLLLGVANSLLMGNLIHLPSQWIQHDMSRTVEIAPGQAKTTGCDLTMAWLLAIVAAYRKIARWQWDKDPSGPMHPYPEEREMARRPPAPDPVYTDARFERLKRGGAHLFGQGMDDLAGWIAGIW